MKSHWILIVATGLLGISSAMTAQNASGQTTPVSSAANPQPQNAPEGLGPMWAELTMFVDAKNAKVGNLVTARLLQDIKANNIAVLHRGTKLIGHVIQVQTHTKEHPDSILAIVFDKAVGKGEEIPLHATIQALAPPPEPQITSGMGVDTSVPTSMGSNQASSPTGGIPSAGPLASSSGNNVRAYRGSGVILMSGVLMSGGALNPASRGVFGISGVSLAAPADNPQASVIISAHNIQLEPGTQMILQNWQPAH